MSLLASSERLALQAAAALLIGAILVGIAETPAYPVALGMEIVALLYVAAGSFTNILRTAGALTAFTNFLSNPTGGIKNG